MSEPLTIGKLLLKHSVPEHLKPYVNETVLDKKGIGGLFSKLSEGDDSTYKKSVNSLTRLGFETSTRLGSTVPLSDLKPLDDKEERFKKLEHGLDKINKESGTKKEKDLKKIELYSKFTKDFEDALTQAGTSKNHTLAKVIKAGARGSMQQYRQTVGSPILVSDEKGKPLLDFPIKNSFADGLTVPEYLLHSYGIRQGAIGTKLCYWVDTDVLMADGSSKKIKDIQVGEFVMGANKAGILSPVKVTNVFDNGKKHCYRYKFRKLQGHTDYVDVVATEDHKVLMQLKHGREGSTYAHLSVYTPTPLPLKKLQKGTGVVYPAQGYVHDQHVVEDRALLLGLLLGDGCTTKLAAGTISLSCADTILLSDISNYLTKYNYVLKQFYKGSYSYRFNYIDKPKKINSGEYNEYGLPKMYSGDAFKSWLKALNLDGKKAHDKELPVDVWQWDNPSIAALIGGVYSCDGSLPQSKTNQISIELTSTSKLLVEQIKHLLQFRFGIYSNEIKFISKTKKQFAVRDQYRLRISHAVSVRRFYDQIPLVGKKRLKFDEIIQNLSIKHHNSEIGFSFQGKEDLGMLDTRDIEVDNEDHLFCLSNGIIGSNSVADSGYFCLSANTMVRMADFTEKPIIDIVQGDKILGANKQGNTLPVTVTKTFANGIKDVYRYKFRNGKSRSEYIYIEATEKHKVLAKIKRGKKYNTGVAKLALENVCAGFSLVPAVIHNCVPKQEDNSYSFSYIEKEYLGKMPTYDLEVDHEDHLYVLANGAVVSNSKQLSRAAMPLVIEEHDCGTNNGIPVSTSDRDSIGTFLAKPVGNYNKNNLITAKVLAELSNSGIKQIIIRSPITCQASRKSHTGAICQLCAGKREKGLPAMGSYLGVTAATALGEPLAQGQLNSKHQAGSAALGKTVATGFKLIDQLANIPHTFQNKAAVATIDGVVKTVRKLPQGGIEIVVGNHKEEKTYYVSAGFEAKVKVNDHVEAGDIMSEGIVNPADIVEHKGIGEGRNYFVKAMHTAFDESGMGVNRRNFEVIARGAVDHVRITHPDGLGEHLPDSIVSYQAVEKDYKPRATAKLVRVDLAQGKYLEEPVLHYTIGTRLTSKMIADLKSHKVDAVHVHDEPPPFHPEMVRLLDVPGHVPDWAHQMYSTYLEKRLIKSVNNGMTSSLKGPSPILGLSYGVGFGKKGEEEDDD